MLGGIVSGVKKISGYFQWHYRIADLSIFVYVMFIILFCMNIKIQYKLMGHIEETIYQHDFDMDITNNPRIHTKLKSFT